MDDSRYGAMSVSVRRSRLAPSAQETGPPAPALPPVSRANHTKTKPKYPFIRARCGSIAGIFPAGRVAIPLQSEGNDAPGQSNNATGIDRLAR